MFLLAVAERVPECINYAVIDIHNVADITSGHVLFTPQQ